MTASQPIESEDRDPTERPLLEVSGLRQVYGRGTNAFTAVDDVSFSIERGRSFGIVGETGSGKSSIAKAVTRLGAEPSAGSVVLDGTEITTLPAGRLRQLRRRMQMVLQDPHASLNRRKTAASAIALGLETHGMGDREERRRRVDEVLETTGLRPEYGRSYPHQLSGGQAQRVNIARALAVEPELMVLDEPVSALDVSTQAQILNLLRRLQDQTRIAFLFIAHDLAIVRYMCDEVAVMYLGTFVERAPRDALFGNPLHPYTHLLLDAIPVPDPVTESNRERVSATSDSTTVRPAQGCRFRNRCPVGREERLCAEIEPPLVEAAPDHWVACHFPGPPRPAAGDSAEGAT